MEINVKIKLTRGAKTPEYATTDSAAVDLRAALEGGTVVIPAGERRMIPTGIAISPERRDVVAVIAARSGLGCKKGINLANGIGVIDADYRGEISVTLYNSSSEAFTVNDGDRIAQMMFLPVLRGNFSVTDELDRTERGTGGFGSTGVK
ncbi:MAG: dUTP diphosphatase [Clostridia bacterium]|nr:dUTP diphosphatase [Clostridia bacterium]